MSSMHTQPAGGSDGAVRHVRGLVSVTDTEAPLLPKALNVLERRFGFTEFREGQPEVIEANLRGHDILSIKPTSAGKSLEFQLPAVMRHEQGKGVTIVIEPLIALARDQVQGLQEKGIEFAFFDSLQTPEERADNIEKITSGRAAMIYVSPERFVSTSFQRDILNVGTAEKVNVCQVVFDEAHLIHQWGHDFRFSYGKKLALALEVLGAPQVFCCSATVTEQTRQDIVETLKLDNFKEFRAEIDRPNIEYKVRHFTSDDEKRRSLAEEIKRASKRFGPGDSRNGFEPTIIFCASRGATEEVCEFLCKKGIPAGFYHAGLEREARLAAQNKFMSDEAPVMVATTAFSMGIDKKDIRRIYHYQVPGSLEQYSQESGRAGRDGKAALAELWYQPEDIYRQIYFIASSNPSREYIRKLYGTLWEHFVPETQKSKPEPKIRIDLRSFFDRDGEYGVFVPRKLAAFTTLIEYGIIDVDGWTVTFKVKPSRLEQALPTREAVNEKRALARQSLMIMNYYAQQEGDDTLRQVITRHFRHNAIVTKIQAQDMKDLIDIDKKRILGVLQLVNRADREIGGVSGLLRGKGQSRALGDISSEVMKSFKHLNSTEIRSVVRHAAYLGYVRLHRRGRFGFVALTPLGMDFMRAELPPEKHKGFEASTTFEGLQRRIGHAAERGTLQAALGPWFRDHGTRIRSNEAWARALGDFSEVQFTILGEKISGRDLVAKFAKRKPERVDERDTRHFVNYLFRDPIDHIADRRTQPAAELPRPGPI